MAEKLLTTTQAAYVAGMDRRNFARWAQRHGLVPRHRVRVGRSWLTVWCEADIFKAAGVVDDQGKLVEALSLR